MASGNVSNTFTVAGRNIVAKGDYLKGNVA